MPKLLRLAIQIPGEFRDIWLYKNRLFVWQRDGVMRFLDLDVANRYIAREYGWDVANLAQTLIFRNDWKVGEQFRTLTRVPPIESAIMAPFGDLDYLNVIIPEELLVESQQEAFAGLVLDTSIYANRLLLATEEGLLETCIDEREPEAYFPLAQRTDFRAAAVSARFGAVLVSAEERGLHFSRFNFSRTNDWDPGDQNTNWTQLADFSRSTSHARHNLLNYTQEAAPSLLRANLEESEDRSTSGRFEESQVAGYDQESLNLHAVAQSAAVASSRVGQSQAMLSDPDQADFEVLGNSNYHLLASWKEQMRVIDIKADKDREVEARPSRKYSKSRLDSIDVDSVLQTYPISGGFVVELFDQVHLITAHGSHLLASDEYAQVRTFESSLRHKEVVGLIHESYAATIGFYLAEDTLALNWTGRPRRRRRPW